MMFLFSHININFARHESVGPIFDHMRCFAVRYGPDEKFNITEMS